MYEESKTKISNFSANFVAVSTLIVWFTVAKTPFIMRHLTISVTEIFVFSENSATVNGLSIMTSVTFSTTSST